MFRKLKIKWNKAKAIISKKPYITTEGMEIIFLTEKENLRDIREAAKSIECYLLKPLEFEEDLNPDVKKEYGKSLSIFTEEMEKEGFSKEDIKKNLDKASGVKIDLKNPAKLAIKIKKAMIYAEEKFLDSINENIDMKSGPINIHDKEAQVKIQKAEQEIIVKINAIKRKWYIQNWTTLFNALTDGMIYRITDILNDKKLRFYYSAKCPAVCKDPRIKFETHCSSTIPYFSSKC